MRMNVVFVNVGADDKSMFSLRQRHSEFIANLVRQFRCNLSRLERLPQMVGDQDFVKAHLRFLKKGAAL